MQDYPNRIRRGPMGADVIGEHFTQIYNGALRDKRLTAKARGMLGWALSHREGFGFSVAAMVKAGLGGPDAVRTGLAELEKYEYLERRRKRDSRGRLGEAEYYITDIPDGLDEFGDFLKSMKPGRETRRSEPKSAFPAQADGVHFVPNQDSPTQDAPDQADPAYKKNNFEEDHAFRQAAQKTPPPPSSVGPEEGESPEAPREEEEIENDDNDNPSAEPRAHLPQEREGEEMEIKDSQAPDGAVGASVDVQAFIASLPGVTGQQAAVQGQFEASIAAALGRGFTLDTLRAALVEHTDWKKARDPKVIPTWYLNAFDKIKDPPPVPVALCDNPAHARQPMPDPINGGCLPCNTLAARGPITKTALQPEQTVELDGDAVTARAAMRKALAERKFVGDTRSRKQTPAQRMSDEADTNRIKANALLSTEA